MKKKKRENKPAARRKPAKATPPRLPSHRPWGGIWHWLVQVSKVPSAIVGVAGLIALLHGMWTALHPEISTAYSDPRLPFAVPFSVRNATWFLPFKDVYWVCRVNNLELGGDIRFSDVGLASGGPGTIPPGRTVNYRCPIKGVVASAVKQATVTAQVKYRVAGIDLQHEVVFSWTAGASLPRWIVGEVR